MCLLEQLYLSILGPTRQHGLCEAVQGTGLGKEGGELVMCTAVCSCYIAFTHTCLGSHLAGAFGHGTAWGKSTA